jgi:hypothetical protein
MKKLAVVTVTGWQSFVENCARAYAHYRENVFGVSTEVSFKIRDFLDEKNNRSAMYESEDGLVHLYSRMVFPLYEAMVIFVLWLHEVADFKSIAQGVFIIGFMSLFFAFARYEFVKAPLRWMLPLLKEHPDMQTLFQGKSYFYILNGNIVFADRKPPFVLCMRARWSTNLTIRDLRPNRLHEFVQYFMETLYLRILWPYVYNPLQLAFLQYDVAATRAGLENGQKVLVLGAGSVPHHMRWKKRLGSDGHIFALDLCRYVIRDSVQIERGIEWFRSLAGKCRWTSTHMNGDSFELPFADGVLDSVIAVRCYEVDIAEAMRVLQPRGKLVIATCGDVRNFDNSLHRRESTPSGSIITHAHAAVVV